MIVALPVATPDRAMRERTWVVRQHAEIAPRPGGKLERLLVVQSKPVSLPPSVFTGVVTGTPLHR